MYEDPDNIPNELDSIAAAREIHKLYTYAVNPLTDAFSACTCKHKIYLLKCLIEDLYQELPEFPTQEKEWEQQRLMEILKK